MPTKSPLAPWMFATLLGAAFMPSANAAVDDLDELMKRCAPKVHVSTLRAIVRTESRGHRYVLSDDGPRHLPWSKRKHMLRSFHPSSAAEAAQIANELISLGHLVGIGPTQVSSQNLARFRVTVEQLLDPCTNLAVGGTILGVFYEEASRKFTNDQLALGAAISAYNTGNYEGGYENGYVRKVLANAGVPLPALQSAAPRRPKKPSGPSVSQQRVVILPASEGVQVPVY